MIIIIIVVAVAVAVIYYAHKVWLTLWLHTMQWDEVFETIFRRKLMTNHCWCYSTFALMSNEYDVPCCVLYVVLMIKSEGEEDATTATKYSINCLHYHLPEEYSKSHLNELSEKLNWKNAHFSLFILISSAHMLSLSLSFIWGLQMYTYWICCVVTAFAYILIRQFIIHLTLEMASSKFSFSRFCHDHIKQTSAYINCMLNSWIHSYEVLVVIVVVSGSNV